MSRRPLTPAVAVPVVLAFAVGVLQSTSLVGVSIILSFILGIPAALRFAADVPVVPTFTLTWVPSR